MNKVSFNRNRNPKPKGFTLFKLNANPKKTMGQMQNRIMSQRTIDALEVPEIEALSKRLLARRAKKP
jgi:hypothetical protein